MLEWGNNLLTDLYKRVLILIEDFPTNGRTINNSFLGTVAISCVGTYSLSKKLFDTLVNYINKIVITYENTSQPF